LKMKQLYLKILYLKKRQNCCPLASVLPKHEIFIYRLMYRDYHSMKLVTMAAFVQGKVMFKD